MVTGGASAVGAHLVGRLATDVSHLVSLAGGVSLAAGLVLTFGALAMVLFENVYLAIHEDHLLVHEEVLRWYAGRSAPHVAGRIREAKRKSAHGLLNKGS